MLRSDIATTDGRSSYSSSLSVSTSFSTSSVGLLVAKSSRSGIASSGESSSSENDRPVFFRGIGPRGRSASFFLALAFCPRCGLASGPKLRLPRGAGGADGSNGRGGPLNPPPGRGPLAYPLGRGGPLNPPGRGGPLNPPGRGPGG